MDSKNIQQLMNIAAFDIIKTDLFEKVMNMYTCANDYFEVGCKYLLDNSEDIMRLFREDLKAKGKLIPVTTNTKFVIDYAVKYPQRVENLEQVLVKYNGKHTTLFTLLKKYEGVLVPWLTAKGPVSDPEPVPVAPLPFGSNESLDFSMPGLVASTTPLPNVKLPVVVDQPNVNRIPLKCPVIKSINDIGDNILIDLKHWVDANPFEDKIFKLVSGIGGIIGTNNMHQNKSYISGSKALKMFNDLLINIGFFDKRFNNKNIVANDTDIFFVDSKRIDRVKLDNTDLVYTIIKTIEEVLLTFDLPCCRVATDNDGNFWVSAQCLLALTLNRPVVMPAYVQDKKKLFAKYKEVGCNGLINDHMTKLDNRIAKYKNRGFEFVYLETDKMMNFIARSNMYNRDGRMPADQ